MSHLSSRAALLLRALTILASLLLTSVGQSLAKSTDSFLCSKTVKVHIGAKQYTILKELSVSGDRVTIHVAYGLSPDAVKMSRDLGLVNALPLGYSLDDGVVGLRPLTQERTMQFVITFEALRPGMHRFGLGLLGLDSKLHQGTVYCFSTPNSISVRSSRR